MKFSASITAYLQIWSLFLEVKNINRMAESGACVAQNLDEGFLLEHSEMLCQRRLADTQLGPYGSKFELNLALFVYPPVIVFGLIGNGINLLILLSPNMRSRPTICCRHWLSTTSSSFCFISPIRRSIFQGFGIATGGRLPISIFRTFPGVSFAGLPPLPPGN